MIQRIYADPMKAQFMTSHHYHARTPGVYRGIWDGEGWQKDITDHDPEFFQNDRNVVLAVCSDGIQPFQRDNPRTMLATCVLVLNLPPNIRPKAEHVEMFALLEKKPENTKKTL